jgi:hypothetical protein
LRIHDRSARQGNSLAIGEGATVGFVGNSESLELVHLHLETRRVREETDAGHLPGVLLGAGEYTVVSDRRNVLPLVEPQVPLPQCLRAWRSSRSGTGLETSGRSGLSERLCRLRKTA